MLSYIDKKEKGKNNILALTTMHDKVLRNIDDRNKLHTLVFYDHTKGGVDVVDLISAKNFNKNKNKKMDHKCCSLHA